MLKLSFKFCLVLTFLVQSNLLGFIKLIFLLTRIVKVNIFKQFIAMYEKQIYLVEWFLKMIIWSSMNVNVGSYLERFRYYLRWWIICFHGLMLLVSFVHAVPFSFQKYSNLSAKVSYNNKSRECVWKVCRSC